MSEYLTKDLRDQLNLLNATGNLEDFPFVVHGTTAMENYLGKPITTMELLIERESLPRFLAKHGPDFYHRIDSNATYRVYGILDSRYCEIYTVKVVDTFSNLKVSKKIEGFENIRILSGVSTFIDFVVGRNEYTETDIENLIMLDEKFCVIKNYSLHPEFSVFRYYLSKAKRFDKKNILPVAELSVVDEKHILHLNNATCDCTIYPGSKLGLTNNRIFNREIKKVLLAVGDKVVIDSYTRPNFNSTKEVLVHDYFIVKKLNGKVVFDLVDVDTFNKKHCTFDVQSLSSETPDLTKTLSDSIRNLFNLPKHKYNVCFIAFVARAFPEMDTNKRNPNNPLFNELPRNPTENLSDNFSYAFKQNNLYLVMSDWTTNAEHLSFAMNELISSIGGRVKDKHWQKEDVLVFEIEALY